MSQTILCKKDYLMENGAAAFLAGRRYPWRWTTEAEQDESGCHVVIDGEIGNDHYLSIVDVINYFESEGE